MRDMDAKKKIMDVLLDNVGGPPMYLSQIAKKAGVAVSTAHDILEKMARTKYEKTFKATTEIKWFRYDPPYKRKKDLNDFEKQVDKELAQIKAKIMEEYNK